MKASKIIQMRKRASPNDVAVVLNKWFEMNDGECIIRGSLPVYPISTTGHVNYVRDSTARHANNIARRMHRIKLHSPIVGAIRGGLIFLNLWMNLRGGWQAPYTTGINMFCILLCELWLRSIYSCIVFQYNHAWGDVGAGVGGHQGGYGNAGVPSCGVEDYNEVL